MIRLLHLVSVGLFYLPIAGLANEFEQTIRPFLQEHCIACHGPEKQKGRLRLDTLGTDFSDGHTASTWIEVRDNINLGEMPPEDEPRPDGESVVAVSKWIASQLRLIQAESNSTGGKVQLRRLSRTEYINSVRDLLKVNFKKGEGPREILPPDGTLAGFDKVSKALLLDPSLMANYFEAAKFVANRAVQVTPPRVKAATDRFDFEDLPITGGINYIAAQRSVEIVDDGAILYAGELRTHGKLRHPYSPELQLPILGKYRIRVRAGASGGEKDIPVFLEIRFRSQRKRIEIKHSIDEPGVYEWVDTFDGTNGGELRVSIVPEVTFSSTNMDVIDFKDRIKQATKEGKETETLRARAQAGAEGMGTANQGYPSEESKTLAKQQHLFVDHIEVYGPIQDEFPPESTLNLYPKGFESAETKSIEGVRETFSRLLPKAFRRPVTEQEISEQVALVEDEIKRGASFHNAMQLGLVAMLSSPDFLYLFEPNTNGQNSSRKLTSFELASRLSYFLWSSIPDDELFTLAKAGTLNQQLDRQVDRMLSDPKADALINDFANQWLKIDEFSKFRPDERIYAKSFYAPEFAGLVQESKEEARQFFREILLKNESVHNFIDSDWIMANGKLASYYDIEGIDGEEFRRVKLPTNSPRGGIAGMLGVHLWGSDGNRTKPVERGKYLLNVLFNDPPDPPPPNAGEVEPNVRGKKMTVRERLLKHQEMEACAGCHKTIDPYGLALENFNAVGKWRDFQDGEDLIMWRNKEHPIINEGTLPNGKKYSDYEGFKSLLQEQDQRFLRGLAEKLMIYALGRTLEPTDDAVLQQLVDDMSNDGHTLRALIKGIVKTQVFQSK